MFSGRCLACARSVSHHLCRFSACNGKFHVGIFLPVPEKEGKVSEEAVVDIAGGGDGAGARVSVQPSFLCFGGGDELLPVFVRFGFFELESGLR